MSAGAGGRPPAPSLPGDAAEFAGSAARLAGFCGVVLGWAPDAFWRSTPAELVGVVGAIGGDAPTALDRVGVAALMEAFPDG